MSTLETTTATETGRQRDLATTPSPSASQPSPVDLSQVQDRRSPDPMQSTDRYRLVTPYTLRLRKK